MQLLTPEVSIGGKTVTPQRISIPIFQAPIDAHGEYTINSNGLKNYKVIIEKPFSQRTYLSLTQDNIITLKNETTGEIQIMNEILKNITAGVLFSTNLSISDKSIFVEGSTFSIYTLTEFLNGLKKFPSITAISIDEINTSDEGIRFKTRIDTKVSESATAQTNQ
jgi:hypothetical protein